MTGAGGDLEVLPLSNRSGPIPPERDPDRLVRGLGDLARGPQFFLLIVAVGERAVEAWPRFK
ncbi:MAG TPA: hypothetical protein VEL75_23205 [Candidatus Methylomirabilis sp.]|nr:hypothetical protein [Candidatus Methylomirabilis sp.]